MDLKNPHPVNPVNPVLLPLEADDYDRKKIVIRNYEGKIFEYPKPRSFVLLEKRKLITVFMNTKALQ